MDSSISFSIPCSQSFTLYTLALKEWPVMCLLVISFKLLFSSSFLFRFDLLLYPFCSFFRLFVLHYIFFVFCFLFFSFISFCCWIFLFFLSALFVLFVCLFFLYLVFPFFFFFCSSFALCCFSRLVFFFFFSYTEGIEWSLGWNSTTLGQTNDRFKSLGWDRATCRHDHCQGTVNFPSFPRLRRRFTLVSIAVSPLEQQETYKTINITTEELMESWTTSTNHGDKKTFQNKALTGKSLRWSGATFERFFPAIHYWVGLFFQRVRDYLGGKRRDWGASHEISGPWTVAKGVCPPLSLPSRRSGSAGRGLWTSERKEKVRKAIGKDVPRRILCQCVV